jgi:S-adenosylmethionine synthetase
LLLNATDHEPQPLTIANNDFSLCSRARVKPSTVYLTVTGTSAEAGDDGEVGRGNRVNDLITPYRPISLEAAAGKNPVTHVGQNLQRGGTAHRRSV